MQGYPPQHGYMVPPMAGQQQMYQQQPGMYQQPPQGYQQCVPTQIALFPSRASANAVLTLPRPRAIADPQDAPQQMHQMHQMQQQPQGNWKDQLNLPVRDERYRTEVRALPTRRPT